MPNYFETVTQPIIAADFDYFRLAREKWELMLGRLAQLGVSSLSLTLPWGFHEIEAGSVDLEGNTQPRRNLVGLLELCTALGFQCLLDLGPTHPEQGLLHEGLPGWLVREENQTQAAEALAFERWLKTLSRTLVDRQWPHGPIVALRLAEQAQPARNSLPAELTEVKWPIWLRKRYKGIEGLNAAYGTDYRTAGEVEFPQDWQQGAGRRVEDARAFLAENRQESRDHYHHLLAEAGWQIPVYGSDESDSLPPRRSILLASMAGWSPPETGPGLVIFQQPFQVEPDPIEVGTGPAWANQAPIRSDGSLRRKFWSVRAWVWSQKLPEASLIEGGVMVPAENGGFLSYAQDTPLKLSLAKGKKPLVYRLALSGALAQEEGLTVARGKLNGLYRSAGAEMQTDGILLVDQADAPLTGFALAYLQRLVAAQAEALAQAASLATQLGQTLASVPERPAAAPKGQPRPLPYTLAEARRGLREADAALRKAMASIGGLETGFSTILGRQEAEHSQTAAPAPAISPEIFEGEARTLLLEIGEHCRALAPNLNNTAQSLRQAAKNPAGFTIGQYQQAYGTAVETAHQVRPPLLALVERLRAEIAREELPLVAWRVHDQLQAMAETLRWGVLRG